MTIICRHFQTTVHRYCAALLARSTAPTPNPVLNAVPAKSKFHNMLEYTNHYNSQTVRDLVEGVKRQSKKA